jgi:hypothetical protein
MCQIEGAQSVQSTDQESPDMNITTIGIDLAKNTFSLRGTDTQGKTVLKKTVSRGNPHI